MSETSVLSDPLANTDREIWRGPDEGNGSYYADSIHVSKDGGIGISCGGLVFVKPVRSWHSLAKERDQLRAAIARISYCNAQTGGDAMKMRNIATAIMYPEKAHIYDPPDYSVPEPTSQG